MYLITIHDCTEGCHLRNKHSLTLPTTSPQMSALSSISSITFMKKKCLCPHFFFNKGDFIKFMLISILFYPLIIFLGDTPVYAYIIINLIIL